MADGHAARGLVRAQAHPPRVAVLVVEECPHKAGAEKLAPDALAQAGHAGVHVLTQVVKSGEDAARLGFTGSPSFRINGRDSFSGPGTASLACRLYPAGAGLRGLPEHAALTAALARRGRRAPRGQMTTARMTRYAPASAAVVGKRAIVQPRTFDWIPASSATMWEQWERV